MGSEQWRDIVTFLFKDTPITEANRTARMALVDTWSRSLNADVDFLKQLLLPDLIPVSRDASLLWRVESLADSVRMTDTVEFELSGPGLADRLTRDLDARTVRLVAILVVTSPWVLMPLVAGVGDPRHLISELDFWMRAMFVTALMALSKS